MARDLHELDYAPPTGRRQGCADGVASSWWSAAAGCGGDPLYVAYHDEEWGVPSHDERRAVRDAHTSRARRPGSRWSTILRKREGYRRRSTASTPARSRGFGERDVERLLGDAGDRAQPAQDRGRDRNARAFLALQAEHGSLDELPLGVRRRRADVEPLAQPSARCRPRPPTRSAMSKELRSARLPLRRARRSATRSCRRPAWSTTTPSTASGGRKSQASAARIFSIVAASAASPPSAALPTASATSSTNDL